MDNITILDTIIEGVKLIRSTHFSDDRGLFSKMFDAELFKKMGLSSDFKESYYSISQNGVIRGMHFQSPPHDHVKLVYVPFGHIIDVVLDLRKSSPTYGDHVKFEMSGKKPQAIYIPVGCAHGFESLTENSCVTYLQTTSYSKDHDNGIRFDSFGMKWNTDTPIMSSRDRLFASLAEFNSPF